MGDDDHMLRPWPILKSDQIGDFKVFSLNAIQKKSPRTGMNTVYYVLNTVDWVNTIAITPNQELVMVEQFRHATNTLELELPGGMMDKLEQDPVMAACRELREETGYEVDIHKMLPITELYQNNKKYILIRFLATPKEKIKDYESTIAEIKWMRQEEILNIPILFI